MKDELTRRAFFRRVGRWVSLAVLGGSVGSSVFRTLKGNAGGARLSLCARCPALGSCTLPDGKRTRLARGKPMTDTAATDTGSARRGVPARLCAVGRGDS